ncbi:MAG: CapA family protein, partial [Flavobacteriales bacterium]
SKKGFYSDDVEEILKKQKPQKVRIIGVGDIMLGTNYPGKQYLPPKEGKDLLSYAADPLRRVDIAFGNCEGTFLNSGGVVKSCDDPSKCYAFRQPTFLAERLKESGFDMMSLANNHAGDFGDEGRASTITTLEEMEIACAGQKSKPTCIVNRKGVLYGMIAFAPNNGTLNIHNLDSVKIMVAELATQCDIVIVSFHGGAEGGGHAHVPRKNEYYMDENRGDVYAFAHAAIDAGADIVFGHGPHILRGIELYNDRIIAYSLGNFCTYSRFGLGGAAGMAPMLEITADIEGKFLEGRIISFKQEGEGGPIPDKERKAQNEIVELSQADFPESPLIFKENGKIIPAPFTPR